MGFSKSDWLQDKCKTIMEKNKLNISTIYA